MFELMKVLLRATAFCLLHLPGVATAQQKVAPAAPTKGYWVELRNKAGVQFNAATYFSPAARARRLRQHLPTADSTDFPVRPDYLRAVRQHSDSVLLVSRWFNAVACRATPAQAAALARLPGVRRVSGLAGQELQPTAHTSPVLSAPEKPLSAADRQLARRQTRSLGADALRYAGLDGQGLRIAVFDVGFSKADEHPAFRELFAGKHVVATYDFARRTPNVFHGGSHGTEVLACLAGRLPDGTALGLATGADYLLARTERMHREIYAEELDWLAAAEWADRQGADVINSSLGYTARRYFPEEMNGRRSLVARAASLAVRKGMLVVSAAGNDGDNEEWRTVGTPADADSVLAVGGLNPESGLHLAFSATGPTADRRLKPNVAAFGTVLTAQPGSGYARVDGTSFASPLVAGLAACLWQQQRGLTAMQLFEKLQQAASLYPYYDYAHGYGLPQAGAFLHPVPSGSRPATVDFVVEDSLLAVNIRPESARLALHAMPLYADSLGALPDTRRVPAVGREESRSAPQSPAQAALSTETAPVALPAAGYLYWHIADSRGVLRRYEVLEVSQRAILRIPRRTLRPGDVVRVFYIGSTHSYPVL